MVCPSCKRDIAEYSNFCYYCGMRLSGPPTPTAQHRLMRSATDCKLGGVCAGFAEYMNADPTLVRLIWALVTLLSGFVFGFVAYLVAWIIMPVAPVYVPAPAPAAVANQAAQTPGA